MSEQPNRPLTRQELYDRVRVVGKEEYVLAEMKRLGFWDVTQGAPKVADELMTRKATLQKELNDLVEKQRQYQDKNKLLQEMRKERMAQALLKREETKKRRIAKREEKAKLWQESKANDIVYLGEGVSGGMNNRDSDAAKLQQLGLPAFASLRELAEAMEISLSELRFLAFHRKTSKTTHYRRFHIPKKTGGQRLISAPMPRLKRAQHWILQNILYKLENHNAAYGFVPQRSIVENAANHLQSAVVINIDLKDFFPTVHYRRIKGLFVALGYSEQLATVFGLLCSEPDVDMVELDGKTYYVAKGDRYLPQGAPTSPAITNLICHRLDKRFAGMATKLGWTYTRYADDLTFSSKTTQNINRVLWQARQIVDNEGFNINPKKIHVMRKGSRQEVTGIVVNEKLNVSREQLRQFRAVLHKIETQGIKGVQFGNGHILQTIQGFANYVNMVNPAKGAPLVQQVAQILAKPDIKAELSKVSTEQATPNYEQRKHSAQLNHAFVATSDDSDANNAPDNKPKDWWNIF